MLTSVSDLKLSFEACSKEADSDSGEGLLAIILEYLLTIKLQMITGVDEKI